MKEKKSCSYYSVLEFLRVVAVKVCDLGEAFHCLPEVAPHPALVGGEH